MPQRQSAECKMPIIAHDISRRDRNALMKALDEALSGLVRHPLMADPPSSHLTPLPLFRIYDFIHNTRVKVAGIPVDDLVANERMALGQWNDAVGRCGMARMMVNGKNAKVAELMGGKVEFGNQTRRAIVRAAELAGQAGIATGGAGVPIGVLNGVGNGKTGGE